MLAREPLIQHLQIAEDDSEQVVEVMGHTAGELADRLQLLRLQQCLLSPFAGRHVLREQENTLNGPFGRKPRPSFPA